MRTPTQERANAASSEATAAPGDYSSLFYLSLALSPVGELVRRVARTAIDDDGKGAPCSDPFASSHSSPNALGDQHMLCTHVATHDTGGTNGAQRTIDAFYFCFCIGCDE